MRFSVYLAAFAALVAVISAQGTTVSCSDRTDIVLVLDGSDSIKTNDFTTMKNASVDFVEEAFRRINQLRIGAVVFGRNANTFLSLTDQSARATSALRAVNKPANPSTYTHEGIKAARNMFNDVTSQKIMIVITDGNSNIPDLTDTEAVLTKNSGITIFTVGVFQYINTLPAGSIVEEFRRQFQAELQTIASNANQVVEIEDFSTLAVEITKLLDQVCISNVIFELRLFDIFTVKGNTVTMTARTLEDSTGSYFWTKDGTSLTSSQRVNFMKVSNREYRLVITDVSASDAGTYTLNVGGVTTTSVLTVAAGWGDWTMLFGQPCSVTCGSGSRAVTLVRQCLTSPGDCDGPVQKNEIQPCNNEPCAGSGPFFTMALNDVTVNEGQRIVITGILSETVTSAYQWSRNGVQFTQGGRFSFNVDGSTYRLIIDNAQLTDAGTYTLRVENQASTSDVTVNGAFSLDLQDVTVRTGQDITVVGTLSSVVSDSYQWSRDGNQLTEGGRITFRVVGSTYYLTITDARQSDVGAYTLQVGSRTSTANVGVVQICVSNMDAFLAIDGSGSIGRGAFSGKVIPALQGFVGGYFASRTDRRLGYVLYSTDVRSVQSLSFDKEALNTSLSNEAYPNSETFTNKALAEIVTRFRATNRPDANKFAIVITDGESNDGPATLEQGRILKDELNVTIIVVAIADAVDKEEVRLLSSGSEYVKEAQALEDLAVILNELIDCVPSWGAWRQVGVGNCNATCGVGYRVRSFNRDCLNASPTTTCTGSTTKEEIESCNTQPCPFWSAWVSGVAGSCGVTCGAGERTRRYTRVCQNQTPENDCIGTTTKHEREPCDNGPCPAWAAWIQPGAVGGCSVACGGGTRTRTFSRNCLIGASITAASNCGVDRTTSVQESCNEQICEPVWSTWTEVRGPCSELCGPSGILTVTRTRRCISGNCRDETVTINEGCNVRNCLTFRNRADVTVTEGTFRTSLTAQVVVPGVTGGQWFKNGVLVNNFRFTTTSDGLNRNLIISNVEMGDAGIYTYVRRNEITEVRLIVVPIAIVWSDWNVVRGSCSELCGTTGILTVTRSRQCISGNCADETLTSTEPCNRFDCLAFRNRADVTVTEGTLRTTLTAQVVVPGVTGGQWFKNGVLVNNFRFTTTSDGLNRNLIISNVEMGDAGIYTYVRQGEITEVRLVVLPIAIVWSDWNVVRGSCSELCGTTGILTVTRSRQCISGNCADETLTSTEPCNRFDCLRNRVLVDVIVNEGTSASLVATVISAGVTGGQWVKDGQVVSGSRFTTRSIGISRLLTIRDIQMGDAGVYRFELGNELTEVRLVVIPLTPTWSAWTVTFTGACDVTCGTGNRMQNRTRTCTQGNCVEPTEDSRFILCTLTPCVVCQNDLEVMLAVDSSSSISRNSFSSFLQPAIKDFAVSFLNGRTDRKLGFVVFSSNVNFEFPLSNNVDDITSAVDNMGTPGGETFTNLALGNIVNTFNASPPNTNKIAIVITDGESTDSAATTIQGNILKSGSVTIVTVGVGAVSGTSFALELQNLASDPSLAFLTGDFDNLLPVLLQIAPDCALASWSEWVETSVSGCSLSCGGGTRTRSFTRTCNNTATSNTCVGDNTKSTTEACNTTPCEDISYRWLEWVEMRTECSVSCGGGTYKIIRTRSCEDPTNSCQGPSTQTILEACNTQACAASFGQWTQWGLWNPSCPTCGPDTIDQVRTRVCRQIPGDLPCPGDSLQNRSLTCNIDLCEGTWNPWGTWTEPGCPTCGFEVQRTITRSRTCFRLPGQGPCSGLDTDSQTVTCAIERCIRVWNVWSEWTTPFCPNCGPAGTTAPVTRSRTCRPGSVGDLFCQGDSSETRNEPCSIPVCGGTWNPWGSWTEPSCPTCGFEVRRTITRSRTCFRLPGQGPCSGLDTDSQTVTCAIERCIRVWNVWSEWTTPFCVACGPAGTTAPVTRSRTCRPGNVGDVFCQGDSSETRNEPCSIPVCGGTWNPWGSWTEPSCPTCGSDVRRTITRSRTCFRLAGQGPCSGLDTDSQTVTCAIDRCIRVWNVWSEWTTPFCVACGPAGTTAPVTRSRTCRPGNVGDVFCQGDSSETRNEPCSIPVCGGTWNPWGSWTEPSCPTCGSDVRRTITRSRTCFRLPGQGPCSGLDTDSQTVTCAIERCIRVWNVWSEWTTPFCVACGPAGTTAPVTRSRTCRPGNFGDLFCQGDSSETRNELCSIPICPEATWQPWGDWSSPCPSPCSDFDRTVTERRTRGCDRRGAVTDCVGVSDESRPAVCTLCPVWRDWSDWTSSCPVGCSSVFISGVRTRRRTCNPRGSSLTCSGPVLESLPDTCTFCPALWRSWTQWSGPSCPTCGLPQTTRQTRTRTCAPFIGQPTCVGVGEEIRNQPCVIDNCRGTFGPWTEWSLPNCPDCGDTGILRGVSRTRACRKVLPTYDDCLGPDVDNKLVTCTIEPCDTGVWSPWNSWSNLCPSPCSNTPVSRLQNRNRNCVKVQTTDKDCPGLSSESQTIDCPVCGVGRWTEWTLWSPAPDCPACGDRVFKDQSRTRRCIRSGFEAPCTGNTVQSRRFECIIDRCPPPPAGDNDGLCLNVRNISGVGYRYHPEDCDKYIQCYFNPNGEVTAMQRSCPFGHYWSQATLRCDFSWRVHCPLERCNDSCISSHNMEGSCRAYWSCEKGRSEAKCCTPSFRYVPGRGCRYDPLCQDPCPLGCTSRDACDKAPVWGEPQKYKINVGLLGWMESKCLNGSAFDLLDCGCSLTKTTTCKSEFDLNFDDPSAITNAIGNWLTSESVKVEEGVAKFDGVGKLSTDTKLSEAGVGCPFVLQFRYLRTGSGRTRQVMASSKDCTHGNTMVVSQYNDSVVIELMSWFGPLLRLPISTENLSPLDWKDFTMVYNGKLLTAMITDSNYRVIAQVSAPHVLLGACGLQFGSDGSILTAFEGQMDEIRLYKCDPGNLF